MTGPLLTLILCYFNEEDYLGQTLDSLAVQSDRRFRIVLVDNNSTDRSTELARNKMLAMSDISVTFVSELQPGKTFALHAGQAHVDTPYVATVDADTIYPPDYVRTCIGLFEANPGASSVLAYSQVEGPRARAITRRLQAYADLFPDKCHAGAPGHAYRTDAFLEAGGFDPERWPYVMEDHEMANQMHLRGRFVYDSDHCCYPSDRRSDSSDCHWTLMERVMYKLLPSRAMQWFWYEFLARRFAARGLGIERLRSKSWKD